MHKQNQSEAGDLYLVATPIGHSDDISVRALKILLDVDCLAAEDTRLAKRLLASHGIHRRIMSYHEHNAARQKLVLIEHLQEGRDVALIADAGTPLISDPGWGVVQLAISRQFQVVPIPGPCALIAALITSGLACHEFCFLGFVPRKTSARLKLWIRLSTSTMTTVLYLSPHILIAVLTELSQHLPDRAIALHKEISKPNERIWREKPAMILQQIQQNPILAKGEFVLLVAAEGKIW